MNNKKLVDKVKKVVKRLVDDGKIKKPKKKKTVPTGVRGKVKEAIEFSESKKIHQKIKDIPKGEDRDQALQKEVEMRDLTDEDVKELMYDLKQKLNLINIKKPEAKGVDIPSLIDEINDAFEDKIFIVKVDKAIDSGDKNLELDFDTIAVNITILFNNARKNGAEIPKSLSTEKLKEFAKEFESELGRYEVPEVDVFFGEEGENLSKRDIVIENLEIKGGELKGDTIYFDTKGISYSTK